LLFHPNTLQKFHHTAPELYSAARVTLTFFAYLFIY